MGSDEYHICNQNRKNYRHGIADRMRRVLRGTLGNLSSNILFTKCEKQDIVNSFASQRESRKTLMRRSLTGTIPHKKVGFLSLSRIFQKVGL